MRTMMVSYANAAVGRLLVGFVDACSAHPVLVAGFFGLMLALVLAFWAEMLDLRLDRSGRPGRRSGREPRAMRVGP